MQASSDSSKLFTYKEAAALLNIPVGTLYSWVSRKQVPHIRVKRVVRFDSAQLQSFIDSHRVCAEVSPCK